jgi:hypothetical protein
MNTVRSDPFRSGSMVRKGAPSSRRHGVMAELYDGAGGEALFPAQPSAARFPSASSGIEKSSFRKPGPPHLSPIDGFSIP